MERYQLIFEKDPDSKVFAPLAEAYRRMGLLDEAIDLAEKGVKKHPHFSSGRVALGKCYSQKGLHEKAIENLKAAVDLSPENILAHQLLADSYLKLGKLAEALQSYKMVLFLNPNDAKIASIVQKLEKDLFFATKTETIKEDFSMEKLQDLKTVTVHLTPSGGIRPTQGWNLERELALLDTRFDRGQWKEAKEQLKELKERAPHHPDVLKRDKRLSELESGESFFSGEWISPLETGPNQKKVKSLKKILSRIENRRKA